MLKYKADRRTLVAVALYYAGTAGGWLLWPQLGWPARIGFVVASCLLSFTCAVIVHNTIHHPIFKSRWMNKVFQVVLSFTYGHSVSAYVPGHNFSHHQHTQGPKDRIRTDKMRFRLNILNQLFFFFRMAPGIVRDENLFAFRMRKENPRWFAQYVFEMLAVTGVKVGLLIYDWPRTLAMLWLPHLYAAWGIVGTNFWQHDGCDEHHKYNHSRSFTSPFLNYIAFNNGYHGAHHDHPGMHWSLLPEYHREHIAPYIHPNLNRVSLLRYLWETHIIPGKRVDYLGNALVLPAVRADEDWVDEADIVSNRYQLGVEA